MSQNPHPFFPWLTAPRRAWLYQVVLAALPLLTLYGIVADQAAPLFGALTLALVGSGTAALHTPKDS